MTIEERAIGSVVVLDVSGRLVLGDGDQLLKDRVASLREGQSPRRTEREQAVLRGQQRPSVIVASILAARSLGGALRQVNPSSRLHQLPTMSKLLTIVDVCGSETEAVESFGVPT